MVAQLTTGDGIMKYFFLSFFLFSSAQLVSSATLPPETLAKNIEDILGLRSISLANGYHTPLNKAAAVGYVITARDMKNMGASTLEEVLQTVPGMHTPYILPARGGSSSFTMRGITNSLDSNRLLFLIDGSPFADLFFGGQGGYSFRDVSIKNLERIEIVRGPGSALYGADAYAGIVNLISKKDTDIENVELSHRSGSFDNQNYFAAYANDWSDLRFSMTMDYSTTDGHNGTMAYDAATPLGASLTPIKLSNFQNAFQLFSTLEYKNFSSHLFYRGIKKAGMGPGVGNAVDTYGKASAQKVIVKNQYSHHNENLTWNVINRLHYYTQEIDTPFYISPPSSVFAAGLLGAPEVYEYGVNLEFQVIYSGVKDHKIFAGTGVDYANIYRVTDRNNFLLTVNATGTVIFTPRSGGLTRVDDTSEIFLPETDRTKSFLFTQDEWEMSRNQTLITGFRFDHYDDFGNTLNPRVAYVFTPFEQWSLKFLYGRAFRAPSFAELHSKNNPITAGNINIRPETIDTYEMAISFVPSGDFHLDLNFFSYQMKNLIEFRTDINTALNIKNRAKNFGKQTGRGVELTSSLRPFSQLFLSGSVSYQENELQETQFSVGGTPSLMAYFRSDWEFVPEYKINFQLNWLGASKRRRGEQELYGDLPGGLIADLRLAHESIDHEISLVAGNLFNRTLRDMAIRNPASGAGSDDYPRAGRSIMAEITLRL